MEQIIKHDDGTETVITYKSPEPMNEEIVETVVEESPAEVVESLVEEAVEVAPAESIEESA